MSSKTLNRTLSGLTALSAVSMIVGAYFLSSMLQKQADTLSAQQKQLAVLDGRQTGLQRAKKDVEQYQDLANIAKNIVPQDKNQAQTVGEIVKIAKANGIKLGSIAFPSSSLGAKVAGSSDALSQLQKIPDISGVYGLKIIVQSATQSPVSYDDFIGFLEDLEQNRRTAQVSDITITPSSDNPSSVTFSLTLQEYIKP